MLFPANSKFKNADIAVTGLCQQHKRTIYRHNVWNEVLICIWLCRLRVFDCFTSHQRTIQVDICATETPFKLFVRYHADKKGTDSWAIWKHKASSQDWLQPPLPSATTITSTEALWLNEQALGAELWHSDMEAAGLPSVFWPIFTVMWNELSFIWWWKAPRRCSTLLSTVKSLIHTHSLLAFNTHGQVMLLQSDPYLASLCRLEKIPSGTLSIRLWSRLRVLTLTSRAMVSQGMSTKLL